MVYSVVVDPGSTVVIRRLDVRCVGLRLRSWCDGRRPAGDEWCVVVAVGDAETIVVL